jgi:hypothetical protein
MGTHEALLLGFKQTDIVDVPRRTANKDSDSINQLRQELKNAIKDLRNDVRKYLILFLS